MFEENPLEPKNPYKKKNVSTRRHLKYFEFVILSFINTESSNKITIQVI